ncbi:MAG: hypothetical protein PVJ57_10700 [Phycisphaerae bacterium]|jgi:hypothetical protein
MDGTRDRQKKLSAAVSKILFNEWDPIDVHDEGCPSDEYDSHVPGVCRLLNQGASAQEIAEHLAIVARDIIGTDGATTETELPIARRLVELVRET